MTNIEILPLAAQELPYLERIDHSYHTDFVWQMEINSDEKEISIRFKEVKLPRSMRVSYPHDLDNFSNRLQGYDLTLVAHKDGEPVGYAAVSADSSKILGMVSDIAVLRRLRRQGIGSSLILAVQTWLAQKGYTQIQLEMQSKNYPAINMANKLGFEFCGFSDRYYPNQDIAIFFGRRV